MANARFTIPLLFTLLGATLALGSGGSLSGCGGGTSSTSGEGGAGGSGTSSGAMSSSGTCGNDADGCFNTSCVKTDAPVVSFKADVLPILRTSCGLSISCHGGENGPGGQHYLGPKNSDPAPTAAQIDLIFAQWINQPPVIKAGMDLIEPSDPEHSFFMHKLDGLECSKLTCSGVECGKLMPPGATEKVLYDAAKRDTLRRWIAQGAKND
jgi:hypothetical protein